MEKYINELKDAIAALDHGRIGEIAGLISDAGKAGRSVYVFGNGDSATNAFHFAADLAKTATMHGQRLKVLCLNENVPLITAWANDESYGSVFMRQLENFLEKDDVVIGISTSGNSPNVVAALEFAKKHGAITIALSAFEGGKIKAIARHCLTAMAANVEIAEDVHFVIGHLIKHTLITKWNAQR